MFAAEVWLQPPGRPRLLRGCLTSDDGQLLLSLELSWLNRVWRRGLSPIDGNFVIQVDQPAPATTLTGEVLQWEPGPHDCLHPVARQCEIHRTTTGWRLTVRPSS